MKYHIEREYTVGPGQTVGGDVRHVSQSGQREIWKVERLDEGDLGGGELAVRAEFAQRGLEDALAERTCRIVPAWMNGNRNRNRQSLRTLETGARLSLKTCLCGRHGTPRRARQAWGWDLSVSCWRFFQFVFLRFFCFWGLPQYLLRFFVLMRTAV